MRARSELVVRQQPRVRRLVRRALIPVLTLISIDSLLGGTAPPERTDGTQSPDLQVAVERALAAERDAGAPCWLVRQGVWPLVLETRVEWCPLR